MVCINDDYNKRGTLESNDDYNEDVERGTLERAGGGSPLSSEVPHQQNLLFSVLHYYVAWCNIQNPALFMVCMTAYVTSSVVHFNQMVA